MVLSALMIQYRVKMESIVMNNLKKSYVTCLIAIVIVVVITGIAICYFKYSDYDIKSEDDLLKVAQSINSENAERTGQFGENINWYYRKGVMVVNGEGEFDYAYRLEKDNQNDDLRFKVKWLVINEGITKLALSSFEGFINLEMVLLPDSMTNLSVDSFRSCFKLKHITIPDNVKEITSGVFANSGLIDVVIPDNTVRIKDFAFSHCYDLETIVLPDNIERVSRYAFGESGYVLGVVVKITWRGKSYSSTRDFYLDFEKNGGDIAEDED